MILAYLPRPDIAGQLRPSGSGIYLVRVLVVGRVVEEQLVGKLVTPGCAGQAGGGGAGDCVRPPSLA